MSENKLEKIAKSLYDDFKHSKTPSDVYTNVMELAKQQPYYFINYLGAQNLVKLTILIWSLIKTDGFKLADKILNNMVFATLLSTTLEHPQSECEECNGNGTTDCGYCGGSGNETCDECSGDGDFTCSECDGEGEICDAEDNCEECDNCEGNGVIDCSSCGGDGEVRCHECSGRGYEDCEECDGSGEIIDESTYLYTITYIITWNPQLKNWFESPSTPDYGIMEDSDLNEYDQDYIITFTDDDNSAPLKVQEGVLYLVEVDDDPSLNIFKNMRILWDYDDTRIEQLSK